jgi:hypothetical protein
MVGDKVALPMDIQAMYTWWNESANNAMSAILSDGWIGTKQSFSAAVTNGRQAQDSSREV